MPRAGVWVAALLAFAVRLHRLTESPEPFGWDGYAWLVQVEHVAREGRLHMPDGSWVVWWLGALRVVVGEAVLAVKVGGAVLAAAVVPAAWALGRRLAGEAGGVALVLWAFASPVLGLLAAELPKSAGLVAPLLAAAASALARRWVWFVVFAAVTLVAHRLGAALLLLGVFGAFLRPRGLVRGVLVLAGLVAVLAVFSAALPNLLHPLDVTRVSSQLSSSPSGFPFVFFARRSPSVPLAVELSLPWVAVALLAAARKKLPAEQVGAFAVPLGVCLFPFWSAESLDLGWRLATVAPVVAAPACVAAVFALRPVLIAKWAFVALLPLGFVARSGISDAVTPPWARYRQLVGTTPRDGLVIAHQGLNFVYDFHTGGEAMAWAPEPALDRTRVWRLVWGVRDGEWMSFAPDDAEVTRADEAYFWVREDHWEAFAQRAMKEGDDELKAKLRDWRNPHAVRPEWMLRRRER